ncbi:oligosaccharide flippase family protein, partial [Akkermansiaceae bacterium]|nr:oligosaccharide flippase family protein [Akkermansiaceae bacterium]
MVRKILPNIGWNFVVFGLGFFPQLLILRLVISWIGIESFGQASLILALWLPIAVVGAVLFQSVTREMSAKSAEPNSGDISDIFYSAVMLCLVATATTAGALIAIGPGISRFFGSVNLDTQGIRNLLLITSFGLICKQFSLIFQGSCAATQNFAKIARVAVISAIGSTICTLLCTYCYRTTEGYLTGFSISCIFQLLIWVCVFRFPRRTKLLRHIVKSKSMMGLVKFGKWQLVAQISGAASYSSDRLTLGVFSNAYAIGQYSVAQRLHEASYIGVIKITEVLFPHFGATADQSPRQRYSFFLLSSWILISASTALFTPIIPLAEGILYLIVGSEIGENSVAIFRTLMLAGMLSCGSIVFTTCTLGLGRSEAIAGLVSFHSAITIVSTILIISNFGGVAAGFGLLIANFVRFCITVHWT